MRFIVLVVFTLVASLSAQAKTVTVVPFDITNVHPGHAKASEKLLVVYLREAGFSKVAAVDRSDRAPLTNAEAREAAKKHGTDLYLIGTIIRIGELAKVSLTMYETATGAATHTDSLDATSPEDMDPVLRRLARSMFTGKRASGRSNVGEITESEQGAYRRRLATSYFGLKVGGYAGFAKPLSDDPVVAGFGAYWLYDVRWLLLEVESNMGFGEAIPFMWNLVGLGVYYPFSKSDTTVYVGGGAGFTMITFKKEETVTSISPGSSAEVDYSYDEDKTSRGMELYGGAGFLLGRQYTVHAKIDIRYFANLFKTDGRITHGLKFMVGIGF